MSDLISELVGDERSKVELQKAIQHDSELLERLCKIVDEAKVK